MTDWATYPLQVMDRGHVLNNEEVRLMCAEIASLRAAYTGAMEDKRMWKCRAHETAAELADRADKVQALVEASRELLRLMDDTVEYHDGPGPEYGEEDPWDMGEWFSDVDRHVIDVTRVALAAFTDAKEGRG